MSRAMNLARLLLCIALAATWPVAAARAEKLNLPAWLNEAVQRETPPAKGASAIVLNDEYVTTIAPDGRLTAVVMEAVRIADDIGRSSASVSIGYDSSCEKITGFRAWLIRPSGDGKNYRVTDASDTSVSSAIYTEIHTIKLSASDDAYKDCVFAYEYTRQSRRIFGFDSWRFQTTRPVALSRLTYVLPKGWSLKATMLNGKPVEPTVSGNTYTWEQRNLPAIKRETMGPTLGRLTPRLNINWFPPAGMAKPPIAAFPDWASVSKFQTSLLVAPLAPNAAVEAKTRELLAGAGASLWKRIDALARFAQSINYISIQMNLGRGGGYTPRAASEVLKTGYGDCKDKSTLLRSMLKVAGIESYAVIVYSGDRYWVTEDWPSPSLFNHMITAIKIDDPTVTSPMIVEVPGLGRLLFFDPTDPFTPLGDLLYANQGALVLALADERGALVRLPFTPPAANHTQRTIVAKLDSLGGIDARVSEHITGQSATKARAIYRASQTKFSDIMRNWINATVRLAKITDTEGIDDQQNGTFDMNTRFTAPGYANMMRDKLLIFKPAIVSRRDYTPLTQSKRAQPIIIEPYSFSETVEIGIPEDFAADELPPPVEVETPFGRYTSTCAYDAAMRTFRSTRSIVIKAAEIPAKDYATVKQFYETIQKAEQASVVLSRVK